MAPASHEYQVGDCIRVKTEDENLIGQPSEAAKGRNGKILRRYTASSLRIPTIWWVGFDFGDPEPIAEDWLEPEKKD